MDPQLVRIAALALLAALACALAALPRTAHGEIATGSDRHEIPTYADRRTDIVRDQAP
jgi:hypothetical protein